MLQKLFQATPSARISTTMIGCLRSPNVAKIVGSMLNNESQSLCCGGLVTSSKLSQATPSDGLRQSKLETTPQNPPYRLQSELVRVLSMAKENSGANIGFEAELWKTADQLRGSMDASEYKHVVLGLLFLKYISDAFEEQHTKLLAEKDQGAEPEDHFADVGKIVDTGSLLHACRATRLASVQISKLYFSIADRCLTNHQTDQTKVRHVRSSKRVTKREGGRIVRMSAQVVAPLCGAKAWVEPKISPFQGRCEQHLNLTCVRERPRGEAQSRSMNPTGAL